MRRGEPTTAELLSLREAVRPYLSDKRYAHTLAVEEEAAFIAAHVLPSREGSIRAAALLHDIAKELTSEKQLNYIRDFGIISGDIGDYPEPVLHALAAPAVISERFSEYLDDDILSAVRYHTTGRAEMTVFEAIVFIADYIEPTRKHESCRRCREYFHSHIVNAKNADEATAVLTEAVYMSLRDTLQHIESTHKMLDPDTAKAAQYLQNGGVLRR